MRKFYILLAISLLFTGCTKKEETKEEVKEEVVEETSEEESEAATPTPETSSDAEGEIEYSCRTINYYDYTKPVPASEAIDQSYYDDTFFGGDSRMGGLYLYGSHKNAEIYFVTSLNLFKIDVMPIDYHEDHTMMEMIESTKKNNVYLLFGINEIRNQNFDSFKDIYQDIISTLRNNNPNVNIYLLLAYHPRSISDMSDEALNNNLKDMNGKMKELALENHCYYLDLDNELTDEEGKIRTEYVFDGLHLNQEGVHAVEDYIDRHVVRRELYVKKVCE